MTVTRSRIPRALVVLLAAAALCVLAAPAQGATTVKFTHESYSEAQKQIAAHQVASATFNKKAHNLHLTLTDGRHVLASYPSHDEPAIAAQIKAAGAAVTVEKVKKKKAAHHKLRYIAGGILIVVILIIAVVLGLNRRKDREEQAGAGAGGTGAVPPAAAGGGAPPAAEPAAGEAQPVAGREPPSG